jgi:hypothetical protein
MGSEAGAFGRLLMKLAKTLNQTERNTGRDSSDMWNARLKTERVLMNKPSWAHNFKRDVAPDVCRDPSGARPRLRPGNNKNIKERKQRRCVQAIKEWWVWDVQLCRSRGDGFKRHFIVGAVRHAVIALNRNSKRSTLGM